MKALSIALLLAATALTPASAADMTNERALNATKEPHNWILHHGNYEGHRFSPLKIINNQNVKDMKIVFSVALLSAALSCSAITRTVMTLPRQITFASLRSFATSSFASATRPPPLRFGGSTTFSVVNRGVTSTPSASGLTTSSGFFFAFMMLGSVA